MARGRGGSSTDVDTPSGPRGGPDDGGPPRRRAAGGTAGDVDSGQAAVQSAFAAGRASGDAGGPGGTTRSATSTVSGEVLPAGYHYDGNGRLRGPDNRYASDPTAPPGAHNRDSEYVGGFRQSTHDYMTTRYTREGRRARGVPRDPVTCDRIPRD